MCVVKSFGAFDLVVFLYLSLCVEFKIQGLAKLFLYPVVGGKSLMLFTLSHSGPGPQTKDTLWIEKQLRDKKSTALFIRSNSFPKTTTATL